MGAQESAERIDWKRCMPCKMFCLGRRINIARETVRATLSIVSIRKDDASKTHGENR